MTFEKFMQAELLDVGPGVGTLDWMVRVALVGKADAQRRAIEALRDLFDKACEEEAEFQLDLNDPDN